MLYKESLCQNFSCNCMLCDSTPNSGLNPIIETRIFVRFLCVTLRVPRLDSETGWTGELWSIVPCSHWWTNTTGGQNDPKMWLAALRETNQSLDGRSSVGCLCIPVSKYDCDTCLQQIPSLYRPLEEIQTSKTTASRFTIIANKSAIPHEAFFLKCGFIIYFFNSFLRIIVHINIYIYIPF